MKFYIAFMLEVIFLAVPLYGADGTWTLAGANGNWSVTNNWQGGTVADGADATAFITANIGATRTVTSDLARTVGHLEFSDSGVNGNTWILGGAGALTLSASPGPSTLRCLTPTEVIAPLGGSVDILCNGLSAGYGLMPSLVLKGTNTFTGPVTVRRGSLAVWGQALPSANGPLGNSTNAIVLGDSGTAGSENMQLLVDGPGTVLGRPVVVNNQGNLAILGELANSGYKMTWSGDITLNRDVILSGHAYIRFNGRIRGTGGITKTDTSIGAGTASLEGDNDFSGPVVISRGTIQAAHTNALGTGSGPVVLGDAGTLASPVWLRVTNGVFSRDLLVSSNGTAAAGFGSACSPAIATNFGRITLQRTLTVDSVGSSRLYFSGPIEGSGGLTVAGNSGGQVFLYGATNTYSGVTLVKHGILIVTNIPRVGEPGPLGLSATPILLGQPGASAAGDEPNFYVEANGVMDRPMVVVTSANANALFGTRVATNLRYTGSLSISNSVLRISAVNATNRLEWTGPIAGTGGVTKAGAGVMVLSGTNTGSGGLTLEAGTLRVAGPDVFGSGRFRFASYGTRLENTYGPFDLPNGVEFGRPAYYYGAPDMVFNGDIRINASLASIPFTVDQANTLLGFRGNLVYLDRGCGLQKLGAGILEWSGTNLTALLTNQIDIQGGALRAVDGLSISTLSSIRLNGGVWESSGTCARTLGPGTGQLYWAASGGFSACGAPFTVDLNGSATNLFAWGGASFIPAGGELLLGSVRADRAVVLKDRIDLNGASRAIRVYDNTNSIADRAVLEGGLQGSTAHGITKLGPGVLALGGTNTYLSLTAVNEGALLVDGELDYSATAVVQVKSNAWLGGRGTIRRTVTLDPGFGGFDWADTPGALGIRTNLSLPRGFTYRFRRVDGVPPRVDVEGTLTASNAVTVQVFGETASPLVLFTAGALSGTQNLTNWVVAGSTKPYTVLVQGTSIIAAYKPAGTVITLR